MGRKLVEGVKIGLSVISHQVAAMAQRERIYPCTSMKARMFKNGFISEAL